MGWLRREGTKESFPNGRGAGQKGRYKAHYTEVVC